jgi:hypothetical protein
VRIHEAIAIMIKDRKFDRSATSVLNPSISAMDAWELVWRALLKARDESDTGEMAVLSGWFEKRVRQVCVNRINPDLAQDLESTFPHILLGNDCVTVLKKGERPAKEPADPLATEKPKPKPVKPFARKFL